MQRLAVLETPDHQADTVFRSPISTRSAGAAKRLKFCERELRVFLQHIERDPLVVFVGGEDRIVERLAPARMLLLRRLMLNTI